MSEYRETRIEEDVPIKRARPVVETHRDSVIRESRGMSGGAIAALVIASIAVGILIAMLIVNTQQRNRDEELAQERDRMAAAQQSQQQQPLQQPIQQPPIVVTPQAQPGTAPMPVPVPTQPAPAATAPPSSTQLEVDVTSKLLDDHDLRTHPIDVKVTGSTAVLSGEVPSDELKEQAEKIARTVKGIRGVINNIVVKPE